MAHKTLRRRHQTAWLLLLLVAAQPQVRAATLEVSKSGPVSVQTGVQFDYDLSYRCVGAGVGDSCEDAFITDQMPDEVEILNCLGFEDHQQDGGISCPSGLGQSATFYFSQDGEPADQPGTLAAGSQGTLKIQAWFPEGVTPDGTLVENTATFSSSTADDVTTDPVVETVATAEDKLTITKSRWSGDTAKGADAPYLIEVCQPEGARIGGLDATNLVISDVIPDGAGFVYASDSGAFVAGSGGEPDRVVWPGTSLGVDEKGNGQESCLTRYVTLNYPSDFTPDETTNTAEATYTPAGAAEKTISADVTHGFVSAAAGIEMRKWEIFSVDGAYPIATDPGFDWRISPDNTGSVGLANLVVTDPVPPQLLVSRVLVGTYQPNMSVEGQYQRESDAASNTWHDLPGNPYTSAANVLVSNLDPAVTEDDQIVALRWRYGDVPPGFRPIDDNNTSRFRATIQNPDRDGQPVDNNDVITNTVAATADNLAAPVETFDTVIAVDELPVRPLVDKVPDLQVTPYPDLSPGTQFQFRISVRNLSRTSTDLLNPVLLDILPPQLQYVSHSFAYSGGWWEPDTDPVFDQYDHPGGEGTILRFAWPDVAIPQYQTAYVDVTVRAVGGAVGTPGQYINLAAGAGYDNPNITTVACRQTMVDTDDVDQDGDSTETLCLSRNAPFNILPSAGLDSVKEVRAGCIGSEDYGSSAQSFANGPVDYRLTVSNPGNVAVDSALFYDIFPFVGDTGVIDIGVARGSEWSPVLTGAVSVPSGATVAYSTDSNPCRPELFGGSAGDALPAGCTEDAWSGTAPADITEVRALRIDFGDITIDPEDALTFSWPMSIPVSAAIGELGNNSFGYTASRTDGGTPELGAAEPNLVQTEIACVETPPYIGDFVWADTNEDGIQDTGESGINGVVVEAFDATDDSLVASTVTAPDGTGRNGFYRFGDLLPGSYYLRFTPPAGYAISPQYAGTDTEKDSDADQSTGVTQTIDVVLGDERLDLDLGLFASDSASIGNYVWVDRNGNDLQDESPSDGLNGVPVRLLDSVGEEVATTTTADDSFGNPGYYLFRGVAAGTYSVEVDRGDTFAVAFATANQGDGTNDSRILTDNAGIGEGAQFAVDAGDVLLSQDAGLVFPSGTLSLGDRVWLDADNDGVYEPGTGDEDGVDGVTVELYEDTDADNEYTPGTDRFVAVVTTFTKAGSTGYYEFTGLPAGAYLIRIPLSNFTGDGALVGTIPSNGASVIDPDDGDVDDDADQNAYLDANGNRVTLAVTLAVSGEPEGDHNPTLDAGFVPLTSLVAIGNRVWLDDGAGGGIANNGKRDGSEAGIDGVVIDLYRGGSLFDTAVTAGGGYFFFDQLPADSYTLRVPASEFAGGEPLAGLLSSAGAGAGQSTDETADENGVDETDPGGSGVTSTDFTLTAGGAPTDDDETGYGGVLDDASVNATADFGFAGEELFYVALGNRVFIDEDDDGIFGAGDAGVDGVTVELYAEGDEPSLQLPLASTTTADGGSWWFDRIAPGRYFVHLPPHVFGNGQPLDTYRSSTGSGGDDANDDDADENGIDDGQPLSHGVTSALFELTVGAEPEGEPSESDYAGTLPDANVNGTLDFGLARDRTITCVEICDVDGVGGVTSLDLREILRSRGTRVDPPGRAQSGDCVADGVITFNDVAACRAYR